VPVEPRVPTESAATSALPATDDLFIADPPAWERARDAFLLRVAPANASWAPLVVSGARALQHVPSALLGAWRSLGTDALDCVRREPERQAAWPWLMFCPSLLLHSPVPTAASADAPPPLSHAERVAALLRRDFDTCLAGHNAGVWRPSIVPRSSLRRPQAARDAAVAARRRAVRLARVGRLSAAARALRADPPAPQTPAVERKARALFLPAAPDLATPASIEAGFPAELARAAEHGRRSAVPAAVPWDAAVLAIRTAHLGSSPGPSSTRMEHLWAPGEEGRDALVRVVLLLTGVAATTRVPAAAAHALAGADLLLHARPGGVREDGLPGLRTIGMPEAQRKLAGSALAATVWSSAADLLSQGQLRVGVPNACERILHKLGAHLAHHPGVAVLQLDAKNAVNVVSRQTAGAVLHSAFPVLTPYLRWTYGGGGGRACSGGRSMRRRRHRRRGLVEICRPPHPQTARRRHRRGGGCAPSGAPSRATRSGRSCTQQPCGWCWSGCAPTTRRWWCGRSTTTWCSWDRPLHCVPSSTPPRAWGGGLTPSWRQGLRNQAFSVALGCIPHAPSCNLN